MHLPVTLRLKKAQKSGADFVSRADFHGIFSVIGGGEKSETRAFMGE
jgi:hypothetical protein